MAGEKCGRLTRAGLPCKNPAGFKTDHVGEGACHLHGGKSPGGKPGNKNAVTTGQHETIYAAGLTGEELGLYGELDVSPKAQVEEEIRLLSIRERRMLLRIQDLVMGGELGTTETGYAVGWNVKGKVDMATTKAEANLERIQRIEEALTKVQQRKAQFVALLVKIEAETPPEDDPLEEWLELMRERRGERRGERKNQKGG